METPNHPGSPFPQHDDYDDTLISLSRKPGPLQLPSVRHPDFSEEPNYFNTSNIDEIVKTKGELTLEDVYDLAKKEFHSRGIHMDDVQDALLQECTPVERLKNQVRALEDRVPIEPLLNRMALETTESIWHHLPDGQKVRYLKHYNQLFNSLRNPMPPASARRLLSSIQNGAIRVVRGVKNVEQTPEGRYKASFENGATIHDIVINTTRTEAGSNNPVSERLINNIINKGIAAAHPFGGLKTDFATNRVLPLDGDPHNGLFALGQVTQGDRYYTSSLYMIGKRAKTIAEEIL